MNANTRRLSLLLACGLALVAAGQQPAAVDARPLQKVESSNRVLAEAQARLREVVASAQREVDGLRSDVANLKRERLVITDSLDSLRKADARNKSMLRQLYQMNKLLRDRLAAAVRRPPRPDAN